MDRASGLARSGVLRYCGCGCGALLGSGRGKFLNKGHYNHWYSRAHPGRNRHPGQITVAERKVRWAAGVRRYKECENRRLAGVLLGQARLLYGWVLGEGMDGGLRLWFSRRDVYWGCSVIDHVWYFSSYGYRWRIVMRLLVDLGLLECRRFEVHLGIRACTAYRLKRVDLGFLGGDVIGGA